MTEQSHLKHKEQMKEIDGGCTRTETYQTVLMVLPQLSLGRSPTVPASLNLRTKNKFLLYLPAIALTSLVLVQAFAMKLRKTLPTHVKLADAINQFKILVIALLFKCNFHRLFSFLWHIQTSWRYAIQEPSFFGMRPLSKSKRNKI